jgi:hypothetical protein
MQGLHFIIKQDQIPLPNQWWKSIHSQLDNQALEMCGNKKNI